MFEKKEEKKPVETIHKKEVAQNGPQPNVMMTPNMTFTFIRKINEPKDVEKLLFAGERVQCCYATLRDYAVFTDKRLIIRDIQGITGTKVSSLTIPYGAMKMYSVETAGIIGVDADIMLWTSVGNINLHLSRNIDTYEVCALIAKEICR